MYLPLYGQFFEWIYSALQVFWLEDLNFPFHVQVS